MIAKTNFTLGPIKKSMFCPVIMVYFFHGLTTQGARGPSKSSHRLTSHWGTKYCRFKKIDGCPRWGLIWNAIVSNCQKRGFHSGRAWEGAVTEGRDCFYHLVYFHSFVLHNWFYLYIHTLFENFLKMPKHLLAPSTPVGGKVSQWVSEWHTKLASLFIFVFCIL